MKRGRKLSNFLLDAKLQLRYAAQMVFVSAALTIGLGALIYHYNAEASRVLEVGVLDEDAARIVHQQYEAGQARLVVALCGFGAILMVVLAFWQVVTTHKIAGPLYYMKREMKKVKEGRFGTLHKLRRGDMLHDFFDVFHEMHDTMRQRNASEAKLFTELAGDAEKGGLPKVAEQLRTLASQREDSVK